MDEDVHGLDAYLKKLDGCEYVVRTRLIVEALDDGSMPIQVRAQELAPDDPTTPGSRIKEGMMHSIVDRTATGARSLIGPSRKAFFAQFPEFGTARQAADPFLRPAFDEMHAEAVRIMGGTLAAGIEAEAAR